jgi:aspartate/methionine/tyrosine aminotransferase
MFERTVCVSSAGKTFSVTGWKIGWIYGPPLLVDAISRAHQFTTYSIATPLQEAVAVALEKIQTNGYLDQLRADYLRRRASLFKALQAIGLKPKMPSGSFFILCDIGNRQLPAGLGTDKSLTGQFLNMPDWNFCRWLTTEVGVTAIPCSAFYTGDERPTSIIRFAFCKKDVDLEEGERRLAKLDQKFQLALSKARL